MQINLNHPLDQEMNKAAMLDNIKRLKGLKLSLPVGIKSDPESKKCSQQDGPSSGVKLDLR